jgi:hypothetical protein
VVLAAGLAANVLVPIVLFSPSRLVLNFWHNPQESQHILVGLALVVAMPIAGSPPPGHKLKWHRRSVWAVLPRC